MNMENERAKHKKKDGWNVFWVAVFITTFFFMYSGFLFYLMLVPDTQLSPDTEKLLRFVIWGGVLFFGLAVQRSYKIVSKYNERYGGETKMLKMLSNYRKFIIIVLFLLVLLAMGIGWYLGHHRPAQEALKTKPVKIYKTVEPPPQKLPMSPTTSTTTPTHAHEADTSVTPPIPDTENTNASSNPEQSDLSENTEVSGDTPIPQENEEHKHEDAVSKEEREASKKLLAEAERALESAKQIQKEGLEMMREAMPIVANHLNTLSTEEQIEMLKQLKTTMLSQTSQFPPELQSLIEDHNVIEEGWKMYLDMLAEAGYTPPRNFE